MADFVENLVHPREESPERFVRDWHGPPARVAPSERALPLPKPLNALYGVVDRWPGAIAFNNLLEPVEALALAAERGLPEKLLFCGENQWVYEWATVAADVEDASVWGRFLGADETWVEEEPSLSSFVLQLLVFEAAIATAPHGASASQLSRAQLLRAVEPLSPLAAGRWRWPTFPTEFFVGEAVVACAAPDATDPSYVRPTA